MIFFVINVVIILTLLNSFVDVFTHQKILNYKNSANLDARAERILAKTEGPATAKENLSQTIHFLKIVDPKSYEKVISNTERFVFSPKSFSSALARANLQENIIEIDPIFSKPFNALEDKIYFASVLVHETEHLKNHQNTNDFFSVLAVDTVMKLKCNPVTNYQYFSNIMRALFMYNDEWCAQISEVKFYKQFNIDYKKNFMKYFQDN